MSSVRNKVYRAGRSRGCISLILLEWVCIAYTREKEMVFGLARRLSERGFSVARGKVKEAVGINLRESDC